MDRNKLISYSLFYDGEYKAIMSAVKNDSYVPNIVVENAITIFDDDYPKKLLDLKYPPFVLYYKGDLGLLNREAISVVGSRKACEYALRSTEALVKANSDKVIISGMAKGIDTCAHVNAERTIAILGSGIDYIYPICNENLYHDIAVNGLLLSEYPLKTRPFACHFPFRNRLICALSERIYIMQSKAASGTMTSVNEAIELGKTVKVLPYDIFSEYGINNNQLIYEGAEPVLIDEIAI